MCLLVERSRVGNPAIPNADGVHDGEEQTSRSGGTVVQISTPRRKSIDAEDESTGLRGRPCHVGCALELSGNPRKEETETYIEPICKSPSTRGGEADKLA